MRNEEREGADKRSRAFRRLPVSSEIFIPTKKPYVPFLKHADRPSPAFVVFISTTESDPPRLLKQRLKPGAHRAEIGLPHEQGAGVVSESAKAFLECLRPFRFIQDSKRIGRR